MTRIHFLVALIAGLVIALPAQADDVEPEPYVPKTAAPVPVPRAPAPADPAPLLDYALIMELAAQWSWIDTNEHAKSDLDDDSFPSLEGSARGKFEIANNCRSCFSSNSRLRAQ